MADTTYSPLSTSTFRSLTDKLYEKRKAAALEIEKMIREYVASNQMSQVDKILEVLSDLARSQNPHNRKGGLIGLAAAAIALTSRYSSNYTHQLVLPVLDCFNDSDSRVRYFACESLYNILKVAREAALIHFSALFDTLSRLAADTDNNVRNGSELLDRLLKDIVTSSKNFEVSEFMCLLRERIHTKNSNVRKFLVSWLSALYTVPDMTLLPFLPEILDGLFQILSDPTQSNRELCEGVLGQFLQSIKQNPQECDMKSMVNVLIAHAQAPDELVQYIALVWLREFLAVDGVGLLEFASGYMLAVLPCLAYTDDHQRDIHDVAKQVNVSLMRLINENNDQVEKNLELESVVHVLKTHLSHEKVQTRVAVLKWIHHLHRKMPVQTFPHMEALFPLLLTILSDTSDEVVLLDLEVLSDICQEKKTPSNLDLKSLRLGPSSEASLKGKSPYFVKFSMSLLEMFRKETGLLQERGCLIIRQLCVLLKADEIFRTLSVLLCDESDLYFLSQMVQALNGILLTSAETFELRKDLMDLDSKEMKDLFVCLYRCWAHQPVAVVALCLLTQNYAHAADIVRFFTNLEITVDFLTEIDKFIQLLESPVFAYLRLHLLDAGHQPHLSAVLYGLLMVLPQTEAFHTLHRRLQCVPPNAAHLRSGDSTKKNADNAIPFESLLSHFKEIQSKHRQYRRQKHREYFSQNA